MSPKFQCVLLKLPPFSRFWEWGAKPLATLLACKSSYISEVSDLGEAAAGKVHYIQKLSFCNMGAHFQRLHMASLGGS